MERNERKATRLQTVEVAQGKFAVELVDGSVGVNLTQMAQPFDKRPVDWLKTQEAKDYIAEITKVKKITLADLVQVRRGGVPGTTGTWCTDHRIAMRFAQWLSPAFSIQVDEAMLDILSGRKHITANNTAKHGEMTLLSLGQGIEMRVFVDNEHEFLVPTTEISRAIRVSDSHIRSSVTHNRSLFQENEHLLSNYSVTYPGQARPFRGTVYTKKGLIQLSSYIYTGYGAQLRAWALRQIDGNAQVHEVTLSQPTVKPRVTGHNRLHESRLMDIMADVVRVEDSEVRMSLFNKLTSHV